MRCFQGVRGAPLVAVAILLLPGAARAQGASREGQMDRFLGSWELIRWVSVSDAGQTVYPFGENAQGQITYTADGRMSAHLMRPPEDPADAPPQHLAYWGTFTVQTSAGTVTHHVIGADRPNWLGSDQVRRFRFEGDDLLILSLGQQSLTWRKARRR